MDGAGPEFYFCRPGTTFPRIGIWAMNFTYDQTRLKCVAHNMHKSGKIWKMENNEIYDYSLTSVCYKKLKKKTSFWKLV